MSSRNQGDGDRLPQEPGACLVQVKGKTMKTSRIVQAECVLLGALAFWAIHEWTHVFDRVERAGILSVYAESEWDITINFPWKGRVKRVWIPKSSYPSYECQVRVWDSHCKDPAPIDPWFSSEFYECRPIDPTEKGLQ